MAKEETPQGRAHRERREREEATAQALAETQAENAALRAEMEALRGESSDTKGTGEDVVKHMEWTPAAADMRVEAERLRNVAAALDLGADILEGKSASDEVPVLTQ